MLMLMLLPLFTAGRVAATTERASRPPRYQAPSTATGGIRASRVATATGPRTRLDFDGDANEVNAADSGVGAGVGGAAGSLSRGAACEGDDDTCGGGGGGGSSAMMRDGLRQRNRSLKSQLERASGGGEGTSVSDGGVPPTGDGGSGSGSDADADPVGIVDAADGDAVQLETKRRRDSSSVVDDPAEINE